MTSGIVAIASNERKKKLPTWAAPILRVNADSLKSQQTDIPPRLKKRDWKAIEYLIPPLLQDWFKQRTEKQLSMDDADSTSFESDKYYTM